MRVRNVVIGMLFVTVIAPIVLYTDRFAAFKASSSRNELLEDATAFTLPGDTRHLNLLPQESSTILKEPIGIVYTDNSTATSSDIQTKDLQLPDTREHKSARVLSAANEQDQSRVDNTIRQVIVAADQKGSRMDGGNDAKQNDKKTRENASQNGLDQQSGLASGKVNKKNSLPTKTDKGMDQMAVSDLRVQQLKDQLIRAKVYLSLPGTKNNPHFTRELRLRIKEVQRVLGDATKDYELPRNANEKLKAMEQSLAKGQRMQDNCAAVVKKLRAMLHSTEEQLRVHRKQTVFLTQLTAKTLPKGLHCLPLHLTTEYYHLNNSERQFPNQEKLEDIQLHHYALFSDNVLATAVVVNSTVSHAKDPSKHVFHIVTDRLNYAAMRMWFLKNSPSKATIQVQNIEEFTWLNSSYSPVLKQLGSQSMIDYYFRAHRGNSDSNLKYRNPKYLSILNHLRFYLPEVFPRLNKVLFLDDDIVVQKDLTALWSLDLKES
uniref:Hexosyltransferase n=1 Tax=Rhizophora mucronata TaxID=61149 RepID=A0A2P2LNI2_RHIMU